MAQFGTTQEAFSSNHTLFAVAVAVLAPHVRTQPSGMPQKMLTTQTALIL